MNRFYTFIGQAIVSYYAGRIISHLGMAFLEGMMEARAAEESGTVSNS